MTAPETKPTEKIHQIAAPSKHSEIITTGRTTPKSQCLLTDGTNITSTEQITHNQRSDLDFIRTNIDKST
ncbi:15482_t:CDS:1, partial [Funneliformis caledonium]